MTTPDPMMVSTAFLAEILNITQQTVTRLARSGDIPKADRGRFYLPHAVPAFVEHRERLAAATKPSAADDELKRLRAREIELRIARDERQLIPLAEATALDDVFVGTFLAELSALPAAVSSDQAIRRKVEDAVFAARERLSRQFDRLAKERRTGVSPDDDDEDEDED